MPSRLDLNLMQVFDVLWNERNVSRTARRISRTQSAVSLALDRLRDVFDDPLFNWNGREMQPTARAEALAPKIRNILALIEETTAGHADEPLAAHREFTIATADYIDALFGASLMRRLEAETPNATVYFTDIRPHMTQGRDARETDLFVMPEGAVYTAQLLHAPLFEDRYVAVAAPDNDDIYDGMPVEDFVKLPQTTYTASPRGVFSHETRHLAELGIRYANRILTPHYMALPVIVAESGAIAIMQERLARFMSRALPLKLVTPPVAYPPIRISMYWHPQFNDDFFHRWLREAFIDISATLPALP